MEPTLYTNDVLIMERISVRLQKLKKGDIVISKCPNNPKQNICKRIVGLPGDNIRNGLNITTVKLSVFIILHEISYFHFLLIIFILNHNLKNNYILMIYISFQIPYGYVWLEGDNSSNSTDSRSYGPVSHALLRGRALCKIFPFREITMFTTKCVT